MSTPSELREAIQKIGSRTIQDYGDGTKLVVRIPDDQVDAILDAVIASLPEEINNNQYSQYGEGHDDAIDKVLVLLQSAKSTSKGEQ